MPSRRIGTNPRLLLNGSFWRSLSLAVAVASLPVAAHARTRGGHGGGGGTATPTALSCGSASMSAAGSDSCTVTVSVAASRGLSVALSSNNSLVQVPASVTVGRGSTSAAFTANVAAFSGTQTVILTASAGGASTTFAIRLSSAGTPAISLESPTVAFGDVAVKTTATQSLVLTSSGSAPLTVQGASVTGSGFSVSGISFPVTLNPSQTAALQLQFDPSVAGAATGSVKITSNASNTPTATVGLSGTGTSSSYQVALAWTAPANSADPVAGYKVFRSPSDSSSYQLLNTSVDSSTSYADSSVQSGSSYSYYVESVDASGVTSVPSGVFTVSIP